MLAQSLITVPLAGIAAFLLARSELGALERRFIFFAFLAHIVASVSLVLYHEYVFRGGDMYTYAEYGKQVASLMRYDFLRYAPEAVNLTLQRQSVFPFSVLLEGTATSSLMGMTALTMFVFGDSMYAACLPFSFFAFFGTVELYKAVRFKLLTVERPAVLAGLLLVPSVVFWSSGIVKEAVVVGALGIALRGLSDALGRKQAWRMISVCMGAVLIALIKPYVLGPLVLAVGAWFYAGRGQTIPIAYKLVGVAVSLGGLAAVARLFPEYSVDLAQTIAISQKNFAQSNEGAGSAITVGNLAADTQQQGLADSLKWAPLGLINAVLRPTLLDINNVPTGIAALEMTVILCIILSLLRRHSPRQVWREVASHPPFLFSVVFVLAMGTSVGLATANLGSLSRYRVPMMPMYVASVLALRIRIGARGVQRTSRASIGVVSKQRVPIRRHLQSANVKDSR